MNAFEGRLSENALIPMYMIQCIKTTKTCKRQNSWRQLLPGLRVSIRSTYTHLAFSNGWARKSLFMLVDNLKE